MTLFRTPITLFCCLGIMYLCWLIPTDAQKPADQRLKTGAFRKTLNMDMLRTYFEKSDKDTSVYFLDKKIWACGQKYRDYQGKYPVIFLTFTDVKFDTWEETFAAIRDIFAKETRRHKELLSSDKCDEYDTPIQQGYQKDYCDKVIRFMRNLFSGGFKDNQHLSFGFIADEVMDMAEYYGAADKFDEICQWYDGYRFGKTEIFNPWSVVNYFSNECEPRPFWVSTGSNDIIGEVLAQADEEIYNRLTSLVNGETFTTFIDTGVIYPQIKSNPSTIYSFLLVTGYLKALKTTPSFSGDFMCEVSLPNREISLVYNKEILQRLENLIPPSTAISVQEAIFSGDNARLKAKIQALLIQSVSSFDTAGENFYHGFMLGLCALLGGAFVTSNREPGDGHYDIQLKPTKKELPGILIELKAEKNCNDEQLKKLSETALQQINDKKYETELMTAGVRTIYKYGVAFSGKKVEVTVG